MNLKITILSIAITILATSSSVAQTIPYSNSKNNNSHHIAQPWHNPHSNRNHHSGSNSNSNYVRHSGPRFNGPHWH